MTAQDISRVCSGELLAGSVAAVASSVSTDTRDGVAGSLFIALRGENFDGNDFIADAAAAGAAGVLAEDAPARRLAEGLEPPYAAEPFVVAVTDTGAALGRLASFVAKASGAAIVAITGSSGKTSTKDILAAFVSPLRRLVSSQGSFNNEVGVPLTLLQADAETEVIVVEMGMQAPGEIAALCRIATPDIAVITNIGPAHLEFAGSIESIAAGKAEIARGLAPGGILVAPHGEALLAPHLDGLPVEIVTFGLEPDADVHPLSQEQLEGGGMAVSISCLGETVDLEFGFSARHHLLNAMAAMAVYRLLGLPLADLSRSAATVRLAGLRGERLELADGTTLINDCYNANPLSLGASLEYLAATASGRRAVAVLGDMGELGEAAAEYHRQAGAAAAGLGIDCLIAVGDAAADYVEGYRGAGGVEAFHFAERQAALTQAPALARPGDVVLVKASRFMRLEELSDAIIASRQSASGGEGA